MPISLLKGLGAALLVWAGQATAATVQFQVTDLPDLAPGQDRWSYTYLVTGTFTAFQGFNIFFGSGSYQNLQVTQTDPPDWLTLVTEPDPGLPADGLLTGLALADTNAIGVPFEIDFVWLGSGLPSAQSVEFFDGDFSVIATGQTTPAGSVPEPGSLALTAGGLALLWRRTRHR